MTDGQVAEKITQLIDSTIEQFIEVAIEFPVGVEVNATFKVNGKIYQFTIAEASHTDLLTQN